MDPKFFSGAQQGIPMTAQQAAANARMMMALQRQQQQQQQQQQQPQSNDPSMQQYNAMAMGNMGFSGAPNLGNMAFAQGGGGDMSSFDQSNFMFMNQVSAQQQQQPFMGQMPQSPANMHAMNQLTQQPQLQQQATSQHPQTSIYASQAGMMPFAPNANNGGLPQQNRGMYQGGDNMMSPNTPQAILMQQQQQQQAAMLNRVKQSPSQSPAMNNAHFQGSPVAAGSPHVGGARMPNDYAVSSPMVGSMSSPVQGQGPGMNRVIPSQALGRYMQNMNASQQAMMQGNIQQQQQQQQNIPSPMANRQTPSQMSPQIAQAEQPKDSPAGSNTPNYPHQQSPMQKPAMSPAPRRSATPGSTTSTPLQQHRQIETTQQQSTKPGSPGPSADVANANRAPSQPPKTETPSPKPSPAVKNEASNSPNPAAAAAAAGSQSQSAENKGSTQSSLTTYVPKTRNVDTYGGVDLKYFDKFDIKPMVPHFTELGTVDIHALIMSLKSGMKMEVTNALNVLTVVTSQHTMSLAYCEDLLDILLDYMEKDIFGECSRFSVNGKDTTAILSSSSKKLSDHDLTYAELFDMSLDEMKSLIPMLEETTSDLWLSLRERCLCIFNIFRNLSFMPDNMEYLARHERFVSILGRVMDSTRNVEDEEGKDTSGREAWFVGVRRMDTLDFRKSILLIFSNIAMLLHIRQPDMAGTFIRLTHDFLTNGPDTYYAMLAAETWAKISVNYENRKSFAKLAEKTSLESLKEIWMELSSVIRRDFFTPDGKVAIQLAGSQLATLEYTVMGLYSIVAILAETSDEHAFREQLFLADRTVPMMILRLCVSFGESGIQHYQVVSKRGMELVRRLVCGTDASSTSSHHHHHHRSNDMDEDNTDGTSQESIAKAGHRMLDMSAVRHMLMMAMLRPHSDPEMLRDLTDLLTLIDGDNAETSVA